jgi:hypothetical protein
MMRIMLAAFLCTIFLTAGCEKSPNDRLVGEWYSLKDNMFVQFNDDGTFIMDDLERLVIGTYSLPSENMLRLQFDDEVKLGTFVVDERSLILTRNSNHTSLTRLTPGSGHPERIK